MDKLYEEDIDIEEYEDTRRLVSSLTVTDELTAVSPMDGSARSARHALIRVRGRPAGFKGRRCIREGDYSEASPCINRAAELLADATEGTQRTIGATRPKCSVSSLFTRTSPASSHRGVLPCQIGLMRRLRSLKATISSTFLE